MRELKLMMSCILLLGGAGFMGYGWTGGLRSIASTQLSRHRRNSHVLLGGLTGLVGKYSRKVDTRSEYPALCLPKALARCAREIPIMFTCA
jgi:hypothetical protein